MFSRWIEIGCLRINYGSGVQAVQQVRKSNYCTYRDSLGYLPTCVPQLYTQSGGFTAFWGNMHAKVELHGGSHLTSIWSLIQHHRQCKAPLTTGFILAFLQQHEYEGGSPQSDASRFGDLKTPIAKVTCTCLLPRRSNQPHQDGCRGKINLGFCSLLL
jgi:hypothetical protein